MMGYGWGMGVGGWVVMALFWVLLIAAVVVLATWLLPGMRERGRGRPETPEEILDRRFALGEIDGEQYEKARRELATARDGRR